MPRALIPKPDQPRGAHECAVCEKAFKNRSELARHQNIHREDKPFVCTECGKKFAQNGQLTNHRNTHFGFRPSKCAFCPRDFAEGGSTGRHEREQHSNFAGFQCPVSGCEFMHKRKGDYNVHLAGHGVSPSSVNPWHHAYTTDGSKIDPTRGLREQLEWEPFLKDGRDGAGHPNRARAKRTATSLGKERQTAPAQAPRTRSSRKRRADETDEDDDEDDEYKPNTRARAAKRVRQSPPEPEPEVKPAHAVSEDAFDHLFTISPTSDHGSNVGLPSGSSSSLTSLAATPDPQQGELQYALDAYGCASPVAGPSASYNPHNVLGLALPDQSSAYLGYQSPLSGHQALDQCGATSDLGLLMAQQAPHGHYEFDMAAFEASLCDGTFFFDNNDLVHAQPMQFQASYDSYNIPPPNVSSYLHGGLYQYDNLAPAMSADLLSASSPLTSSSQGTSRSPSPLGLGLGSNGFSVPSISSLGRARANAQLIMPQVYQDIALLHGYPTSM